MDTLRNEPVILTGNGGMGATSHSGGYGGGGDFLSTILAASLLGGGGFNNRGGYYQPSLVEASSLLTQQQISDTRSDVKSVESEIRETLHAQQIGNANEARHLDGRIAGLEKSAVEGKYEGIISSKDAQYALHNKLDRENDQSRKQMFDFQVATDKQFACLQNQLNDKFNDLKMGQLQDEIRDLRRSNDFLVQRDQTASIAKAVADAIKAAIPHTP